MSNLDPSAVRRNAGFRYYPAHPIQGVVWSKLWAMFLTLPAPDRFQHIADKLETDRLAVAAVLSDPELIDLREMAELAWAMGGEFDFKVQPRAA